MPGYDIVLFDFDGTLVDTGEGITKSVKYALKSVGIKEDSYENLCRFIGPSLKSSFKEFYSLNDEDTAFAIEKYRERYREKCVAESKLYEGTQEMLDALRKSGAKLATASTKPHYFVERISRELGIYKYFDVICGSEMSGERSDKKELIEYALKKLCSDGSERIAMVGDRCFDAIGARKCGVDFIGVLFGFGHRNELECEGCTALVNDNDELLNVLLN